MITKIIEKNANLEPKSLPRWIQNPLESYLKKLLKNMSNLGGMGDFRRGGSGVKVAHVTLKGGLLPMLQTVMHHFGLLLQTPMLCWQAPAD